MTPLASSPPPHESVARPIATDGADRLRQRPASIEASGSGSDNDALVAELLDRIRDLLHVDTATVLLLDPSGEDLVATASSGLDDQVRHGLRVPVDEFTSRIAATGEPVVLDRIDTTMTRTCGILRRPDSWL